MNPVYDNDNIFAKILREELPCIKIYEDEHTLAFMDIMPQREGHTLVIPKEPAVTLYQLSSEAALACMKTVQKIGPAVQKATGHAGSSIFQLNGENAGQTVPHIHFHILPGSVLNIDALKGHAAVMAEPEELQAMADKIISALNSKG